MSSSPHQIVRASARIPLEPWRTAANAKDHAEKKCGGSPECRACQLLSALGVYQRRCVQAMNAVARVLWRVDGAALDALYAEHGPSVAINPDRDHVNWPMPDKNVRNECYHLVRSTIPALASGAAAEVVQAVWNRWATTRYEALVRCERRPAHYTRAGAVPVRAQNYDLRRDETGQYTLHFTLSAAQPGERRGRGREWQVPIVPRDEHHREILSAIAEGRVKPGSASLQRDRRRPSRWYVRFAYTREVAKTRAVKTAAVNRGIACFIAAVTSEGDQWLYDGHQIEAYLKRLQAERRRYQYDYRGSGRMGRGRARALRPIERLEAKGQRWRATRNQSVARRLATWLSRRGIGRVYIENFAGIRDAHVPEEAGGEHLRLRIQEWPYYDLGSRLRVCLHELGIEVVEGVDPGTQRDEGGITETCPRCGKVDRASIQFRYRRFQCTGCSFKRHLDASAARNVLARGEREMAAGRVKAARVRPKRGGGRKGKGGSGGGG